MKRCVPFIILLAFMPCSPLRADEPASKESSRELDEARRSGWEVATFIVDQIKAGDLKKFPGLQTWLKDFDKVAQGVDPKKNPKDWIAFDIDTLTIRNPNFWPAYYEIAPGDPGLMLLQAGLLMGASETTRASHLLVVAKQRPGIPNEANQLFNSLLDSAIKSGENSNRLVSDGIKLHDKGNYSEAIKKYSRALEIWPQNGFAHFELGISLYHQELVKAGKKPPALDSIIVNGDSRPSAEVKAAYAKARRHDPFQLVAYQGGDKEVIAGFMALAERGMPVWKKIANAPNKQVSDKELEQLAGACQDAQNHELGLTARQIVIARRKGYAPADHPFLTTSLNSLAPGKTTEALLKKLAVGELTLRQLIAPDELKK